MAQESNATFTKSNVNVSTCKLIDSILLIFKCYWDIKTGLNYQTMRMYFIFIFKLKICLKIKY